MTRSSPPTRVLQRLTASSRRYIGALVGRRGDACVARTGGRRVASPVQGDDVSRRPYRGTTCRVARTGGRRVASPVQGDDVRVARTGMAWWKRRRTWNGVSVLPSP